MPNTSNTAKRQPNILLIMSDQHHAGVLGCAGDTVVQTPHLDRLAARGMRFSNAYCASPLCGPSRMSLMTARQPCETGLWSNTEALSSDIPTFAHAFLAGGYETVLSGRMHFVGADQRHGFRTRLLGDVPESAYLAAGWKLSRVLGTLADTPGYSLAGILKSGPGRTGYHAYDETVTAATVAWLQARGRHSDASPFLLVTGFAAPHCPFVAPPADFAAAAARIGLTDLPAPDPNLHPWLVGMQQSAGILPPPPRDAQWRARVAYYGLCAFLDRQVGTILDALAAAGLTDNTIVVYTSDHGEMLGEHGLWWKSSFYEGSVRVPLLVAQPGDAEGGGCCKRNVSLNDIGPTLLELAGLPPMPGVSGRSFTALLRDAESAAWPDWVLAELAEAGSAQYPVHPRRMLKSGPWKYCHYHGAGETLFNLDADPGERHNLAAARRPPPILAELRAAALAGWDPVRIEAQLRTAIPERALIGAWVNATHPPEPDPLWFDTPPENYVASGVVPPNVAGASCSRSMVAGASCSGSVVAGASCSDSESGKAGNPNGSKDAPATTKRNAPAAPVIALDWHTLEIHHGYLPHWTCENAIYHVGFRLVDAIPQATLDAWLAEREQIIATARQLGRDLWEQEEQQLQFLYSEKIEAYLDAGHGECWLKQPAIAGMVADALRHFDGQRYVLHAWCIMPNHTHAIVQPLAGHLLAKIVHSWKSYTATAANRILKRRGKFWQHEPYDHIIRSAKEYVFQIGYVWQNPEKAGVSAPRWKVTL